jgi:hypothetical protein
LPWQILRDDAPRWRDRAQGQTMPRGGKREGAGRKVASLAKASFEIDTANPAVGKIKTLTGGESPGDILLHVARYHMGRAARLQHDAAAKQQDPDAKLMNAHLEAARRAAADAAPYCHTRFQAVSHSNPDNTPLFAELTAALAKLSDKEMLSLERLLGPIAAAARVTPAIAGSGPIGNPKTKH